MSTTKVRKSKTSNKIDYSIFYNQPLIVVSCVKHSQKDGMFVTKFTSKLNNNPMIPIVSIGLSNINTNDWYRYISNVRQVYILLRGSTWTIKLSSIESLIFITEYNNYYCVVVATRSHTHIYHTITPSTILLTYNYITLWLNTTHLY